MKRWLPIVTALAATAASAFGLSGSFVTDVTPNAALVALKGPGSAQVEELSARTTTQSIVSDSWTLLEGISLSGAGWMLLDSLPTSNPTLVPDGRLDVSSRLLQLEATWQVIPGALVLDVGKQIIHPSSGFFKTPLNLLTRGAAGNTPQSTPAASPQWEEGWWGNERTPQQSCEVSFARQGN